MNRAAQAGLIVRTKLTPPHLPRHTLARPRLTDLLLEAAHRRLTIVQAGTGYGKSTALAALARVGSVLAWYDLHAEDADPLVFLLHLYHSLQTAVSTTAAPPLSTTPLALLEQWTQNRAAWTAVTDLLSNELAAQPQPIFLVLDDAHRLRDAGETLRILDRFIGRAPQQLHVILSTRYPLQLPTLLTWRVRGELLEIGQEALAFTPTEITSLFRDHYTLPLTATQTELLAARSEGWAIALQLVWQRLQNGRISLDDALGQLSGGDLFRYLAQEVLEQQPPDIQAFLRETAVLRQLTIANCDALRRADDSEQILRYLRENGLFVMDLSDGHMRYHHLFRDLIQHQLTLTQKQMLHNRAAAVYQANRQTEAAIYHFLEAGAFADAAGLLAQSGRELVQAGRLDTLANWIGLIPPDILAVHPPLLVYLGDIARLHSRFDEALGWYKQAEAHSRTSGDIPAIGQALRGQARVYLDTVNPSQAEQLLQEALRLSEGMEDRESQARLLDLLAENMLNQGRVEKARLFQVQAHELRQEGPNMAEIPVRLLLRTGRLDEARQLLEERLQTEQQEPVRRPRAHRETLLILSLILSFQGEQEAAYQYAQAGIQRGEALQSQFITAVGYMRQGHARMLCKDAAGYEEGAQCFQEAIRISETLLVPRLKVEAYWGLCQAYGFRGDLLQARETADKGLEIAQAAGDEWVTACIRVTLGAAYALAAQYDEAIDWLAQADTAFRESGDNYGQTVTRLWQSLVWYKIEDHARLQRDVTDLLYRLQTYGYDYLLQRRTLFGPPDPRAFVPLLLFGRDETSQSTYATQLLQRLGLARLQIHPGYQLRLQLMGSFQAWRGTVEITTQDWKRKKARQLFLMLVSFRQTLLEREQIIDMLWPDLPPDSASRDFKIAFSALLTVLEPERGRNAPSAFIVRDDSRYGLRPEADIWLDTAEFERLITQGNAIFRQHPAQALPLYREALALYQGDYLQEYLYETWCTEERERLLTLYLRAAERLVAILLDLQGWEETIEVAQAILGHDDCWENAYRSLMLAYAHLGNRAQVIRTYQRCLERLTTELGVEPATATTELYHSLV